MNLLVNGGFEGITRPGGYTRETHSGEEHGNWVSPEGWVGWWDERAGRRRPETELIPLRDPYVGPPRRIHEGGWAVKVFVSFHPWEAGFYQVVEGLEVGRTYEAGFWAHAWCNNDGLPNADDPGCAPMGCGALYRLERDLPALCGDPVQDAWWSGLFQVGVQALGPGERPDPTFNVRWGEAAAIYNVYAAVPAVVFEPRTERVAVFLRAAFRWEFRNNDGYLDGAWLRHVGTPPPIRTYERTYVLYPPDAMDDEILEVTRANLEQRRTVGGSADDAGIEHPNCTMRTVVVYWPHRHPGGRAGLQAFFDTFYPGIDEIIWIGDEPPLNPLLLGQKDPRWAGQGFGDVSCSSTIGEAGCFITCLAMWQRALGLDLQATPVSVDAALGPEGYWGCVANWGGASERFAEVLGVSIRKTMTAEAIEHLDAGGLAMVEVEPASVRRSTGTQHFVLVARREDARFWMRDPLEEVEGWLDEFYPGIESWRLLSQVEPAPAERQAPTLHLQTMEVGWERYVRDVQPTACKAFGMEDAVGILRASPTTRPVIRIHNPEESNIVFSDPNPAVCAGRLIDHYEDSMHRVADQIQREFPSLAWPYFWMEGPNEMYATGLTDKLRWVRDVEVQFCKLIRQRDERVAPVPFCAAVGNPGEWEFADLVPLARACEQAGGMMGYHNYWFANPNESGLVEHWPYLAGRWTEMATVFADHGTHPDWFGGESGAVGGQYVESAPAALRVASMSMRGGTSGQWAFGERPERVFIPRKRPARSGMLMAAMGAAASGGYILLPMDGWMSPKCYNGDFNRYMHDILVCSEMNDAFNATHVAQFYGGALFTTGAEYVGWASFKIWEAQMLILAAALA